MCRTQYDRLSRHLFLWLIRDVNETGTFQTETKTNILETGQSLCSSEVTRKIKQLEVEWADAAVPDSW